MIIIGTELSPRFPTNCVGRYGNRRLRRTAAGALRGSREVLPRSRSPRRPDTSWHGSQWTCTLVRTTTGGVERGVVDRRRGRDPHKTSTQAKDRSPGCTTDFAFNAGRSFSADLGPELGKPGSTAIVVAPAPDGAGAHPHHEPVAGGSPE